MPVHKLNIKIFADGADIGGIREMYAKPWIRGFTTNPTLMRKAGISDYKAFAMEALKEVPDRPFSFEVFADEFDEMERQAMEIASWGTNVNVKIPITNTKGESTVPLVERLSRRGVQLNVTAMFTQDHARTVVDALAPATPAIISIFAGRIADAGIEPRPVMEKVVEIASLKPKIEVLWASPREVLNIFHAQAAGCHIITLANDILGKLPNIGKDLDVFSLETVRTFYQDAQTAGYDIDLPDTEV